MPAAAMPAAAMPAAASPTPLPAASPTPAPTLTPPFSPSPPPPPERTCKCGDSHPYCGVNGWCYESSISPHWDSAACKGTCQTQPAGGLVSPPALPAVPPPSPPPPPSSSPLLATGRCQCGDSHPYCHVNGWCYQSSTSPLWDYSCEGGCETQPPDKPSIRLPNRTHLVFNHLPKCAGTELSAVLEECLPASALTVVGEFARTSASSQQRSFIVSSIREPCSAYLSLWAYGVAGLGKFREDCPNPELYYPSDGNPSASLHADMFLSWLTTPARRVFQQRFDASFPDPSAVDCWVRVERLDTDLLRCLHAFEVRRCRPRRSAAPVALSPTPEPSRKPQACLSVSARQAQGGGPVDWAKVEVGLLGLRRTGLDMVSSPGGTAGSRVRAEYARWRRAKGEYSPLQPSREGADTNLQINPSTHDACSAYFDQNSSRLVMQEQQAIYHAFGYVRRAPSSHAPTATLPTRRPPPPSPPRPARPPAPTRTYPADPSRPPAQHTVSSPRGRVPFRAQVQCCGKGGASTNQPSFGSGAGRTGRLRSLEAPETEWDERSQGRERTGAAEVLRGSEW